MYLCNTNLFPPSCVRKFLLVVLRVYFDSTYACNKDALKMQVVRDDHHFNPSFIPLLLHSRGISVIKGNDIGSIESGQRVALKAEETGGPPPPL